MESRLTAIWVLKGWRDQAKKEKEKELIDIDNSVVTAGGEAGGWRRKRG